MNQRPPGGAVRPQDLLGHAVAHGEADYATVLRFIARFHQAPRRGRGRCVACAAEALYLERRGVAYASALWGPVA